MNWPDSVKPDAYITDKTLSYEILFCPSDNIAPVDGNALKRSYGVNEYDSDTGSLGIIGDPVSGCTMPESVKIVRVTKPSTTLLLGDNWRKFNYCGAKSFLGMLTGNRYVRLRDEPYSHDYGLSLLCHDGKGRANLTMVDGHVELKNGKIMLEGSTNIGANDYTGSWLDHAK